ncbi:hypothetical protein ANN_24504 [Periplaneta americana]|uniref:HTH psq-type domain-containing protein n=1 Tax=Periplaneta americana TaxID=6978 RepID=A0ABQ8S3J9_PERAM|nr:hypothetical protein ANN_24504 [Periplaneta americana]
MSSRKRKQWSQEAMKYAVKEKRMGYLKASKTFHVPRSTLVDFVKSGEDPEEEKRYSHSSFSAGDAQQYKGYFFST